MGRKEGAVVPLSRIAGTTQGLIQCGLGRGLLPYQVASSSIQPFGHNRHGPKIGWGWCALFSGVAGSLSNTKSPGPRPSSIPSGILIHAAILPQHADMSRKLGAVSLWGGGPGSPSNTMCSGPRPTCLQSFTLIHPTIWPQQTNVTDRQDSYDRTDRTTVR